MRHSARIQLAITRASRVIAALLGILNRSIYRRGNESGHRPESSAGKQGHQGQAHFAPKTPQNEPVPDGFGIGC